MSTVEVEARIDELPVSWRKERSFNDGDQLIVTVKSGADAKADLVTQRKQALERATGVWADRTDEEIEAWQKDMRDARQRRSEALFPDDPE